ncbi:MAG: hypothetical protein ABSG81_08945 [Acidimicrobiales bacterium]
MSDATDAGPDGRSPTGTLSLRKPRAETLAEALAAPPDDLPAAEDIDRLRQALGRDLLAVAGDLPAGDSLRMDAFTMRLARRHPERCMHAADTEFVPTPRNCRRAVGIAAVRACVRGASPGPAAAVAEVLASGVEDVARPSDDRGSRPPWWAGWYAGLPAGGQAVVQAEAVAWATRLLTAVAWGHLSRPAVIGGRDDWWQCPGSRSVVLRGQADVRVPVQRRLALLVVGTGRCPEDWRTELCFPGLVATLVRDAQAAPCRVVGIWPDSGQVRVLPVSLPMLRAGAVEVVSAVATWVDGRIEARRPTEVRDSA